MGSVLLCRNRQVNEPYYVEALGIMLYSAEELSYYIYHNATLIEENFLDERLFRFIGQELAMEDLEHKLRKWKAQAELSELLLVILQDIHYYDSDELYTFREEMNAHPDVAGTASPEESGYAVCPRKVFCGGARFWKSA